MWLPKTASVKEIDPAAGMWTEVGFFVLFWGTVFGKLSGDHICPEENRYTVNVTEYFIRNSTVRKYEWCLNVPPRCSKYSTKLVNDSRVVEKEVADLVDKCCSGYEEDSESGTCKPICPDCVNGKCNEGKCECDSGYNGEFCEKECGPGQWGKNCKFGCECERGSCDSKTGKCNCPPGWTGSWCERPCPVGFYGSNCAEKCSCGSCDYVTGECEERVSSTTFVTTFPEKKSTKTYILTKSKSAKNLLQFKNNGKFGTDKEGLISTASLDVTVTIPATTDPETPDYQVDDGYESPINVLTTERPEVVKSAKVKEVSEASRPLEENYLNDEAHGNINQPPLNRTDLVNGASAAVAISVAVILVAFLIVTTNHFIKTKRKEKEEKEEKERKKGVSTVSVYTHSIFHAPLPEPPTFENPIFIAAAPLDTSSNEGQRIETRVVCSMNFPTHSIKDPREYLYDHPPSTGSYRAASIPEPPDINMSPTPQSLTQGEPLYDEIPSGMAPTPVSQPPPSYRSSLYMNTCGKTRL